MARGKVKNFDNKKGYGFIVPDNGGGDIFVHYTKINSEGYKTLNTGDLVEFDVIDNNGKKQASNVTKI